MASKGTHPKKDNAQPTVDDARQQAARAAEARAEELARKYRRRGNKNVPSASRPSSATGRDRTTLLSPREAAARAALSRHGAQNQGPSAPARPSSKASGPPRPITPRPGEAGGSAAPAPLPLWEVTGYVPNSATRQQMDARVATQAAAIRSEPMVVSVESVLEVRTLEGEWVPLMAYLDTGNGGCSLIPVSVARRLGLLVPGPIGAEDLPVLRPEAIDPARVARGPWRPGGSTMTIRGVVPNAREEIPVARVKLRAPAGASTLAQVEEWEDVGVTMNERMRCDILVSRRFIEKLERSGWTVRSSTS